MQVSLQSSVASRQLKKSEDWRRKTEDFLLPFGPFEPSPTIAVALSGGADSMACTLLAYEWAQAHGGRIVALTVDHALRPESRDEAEQVAQWMRARGIEHHILTPDHTPAGNNKMQAARQWRYDALADYCRLHGILHCLIAHHAGDQRETVLLHQQRGDTEDGGSGMAHVRHYRGVRFLRPLLDVEKDVLQKYLRRHAVAWIEDPSNENTDFARVRIRKKLQNDAALRAATDAAIAQARIERTTRETAVVKAAACCVTIHPAGYAALQHSLWMLLEESIANQLLADTLRCISGATHRARRHEIERLAAALRQPSPAAPKSAPGEGDRTKAKCTLQSCIITWDAHAIIIAREPARVAAPVTLRGVGQVRWDKRFDVHYDIPEGHEYQLGPLGARGKKQLRQWVKQRNPSSPESPSDSRAIQKMDSPSISHERNSGNDIVSDLPPATPALWHLEELVALPHIDWAAPALPPHLRCTIGFAPAKPLAAAPFW